jgi:hypothetical protein
MNYVGQHCSGWCQDRIDGKQCQCVFDREYERLSMEKPGAIAPATVQEDLPLKDNMIAGIIINIFERSGDTSQIVAAAQLRQLGAVPFEPKDEVSDGTQVEIS